MRIKICLNDFTKIKEFIKVAESFESDIDVIKGRYLVDGKSLLALFTLDLSQPIEVMIHGNNEKELTRFEKAMEEFAC